MIDQVTLDVHIKYISQLLTEQKIPNTKYLLQDMPALGKLGNEKAVKTHLAREFAVPWIKINISPIYYLYFYKGVVNPPEIMLHTQHFLPVELDTFYNFDDLSNPKAYHWLIQIISHIHQTNLLINQYGSVLHNGQSK
jgi:hypothetical protein